MSTPTNKKVPPKQPLTLAEIIIRADVETIRAALEARQRIDGLLAERAAAYARIAALERQVDEIVGEPGVFVFPAPQTAVAAFAAAAAAAAPKATPAPPAATAAPAKPAAPAAPEEAAPHADSPAANSRRVAK